MLIRFLIQSYLGIKMALAPSLTLSPLVNHISVPHMLLLTHTHLHTQTRTHTHNNDEPQHTRQQHTVQHHNTLQHSAAQRRVATLHSVRDIRQLFSRCFGL